MKEGGRPIRGGREAAREEGSGGQREYQTKKEPSVTHIMKRP